MAFDPVPFFVGGGAQHSAEVLRLMAYLATDGLEGVMAATDLLVVQNTPAAANVVIRPGDGVAVSKYPNVGKQSYIFRALTDTVVPVTATGGTGRSDLVVARIRDPHIATSGDPLPPSIPNGPYVYPEVYAGVPSTAQSIHTLSPPSGYTGITLARLDIPSSTATITSAMIKDLRSVAKKSTSPQAAPDASGNREADATLFRALSVTNAGTELLATQTGSYIDFPAEAVFNNVAVPEWCTHIAYFALMNPQCNLGDFWGKWHLTFGGNVTTDGDMDVNYESDAWHAPEREVFVMGGVYTVPVGMRGTKIQVKSRAKSNTSSGHSGKLYAGPGCIFRVELDFIEAPAAA